MFKASILFLATALLYPAGLYAQNRPCATDEQNSMQRLQFPQISIAEERLERNMQEAMQQQVTTMLGSIAAKGTGLQWNQLTGYDTDHHEFHIPVVVHITHNYGAEYVSDNNVYAMIQRMNVYFHKLNSDTNTIIQPFKEYAGNARITFHLATKDPFGQPTTGITRRYSYLTYGGDEEAKFDQWPATRYLNIWSEQRIGLPITGGTVAAYSRFPATGSVNPFGDGIITNYAYVGDNGTTVTHEAGHFFNLLHTWSTNGSDPCLGTSCGDDAVDDTPPTKGHFAGNCPGQGCPLYDTVCSINYKKTYNASSGSGVTIDFPDTVNTQNIMDYSDCNAMFTIGQVGRMRAALRDSGIGRYKLADISNLIITGVMSDPTGTLVPRPDLAPIADFSVNRNFVCAGAPAVSVTYADRSWRDTVTNRAWTFSNGTPATSATANQLVTFSQPGWVTTTLTATSNVGSGSITRSDLVYAADPEAISPVNYYQEFEKGAGSDVDKYPIFNYYGLSDYKWELSNHGFYDHSGIMFRNYDPRPSATPSNATQSPRGHYADFFTRAFDLSGSQFAALCNLTFFSSGANRMVNPMYMNDTLLISYSTDCGAIWRPLGSVTKADLANNGYIGTPFYPGSMSDWKLTGLTVPAPAKTSRVYFRFRFISGTDEGLGHGLHWGTGNNFFLDRINITSNPVGVNALAMAGKTFTVSPNPTNNNATITLSGGNGGEVTINVTDVTGKVVFETVTKQGTQTSNIEIPATAITVSGIYFVNVLSATGKQTQKLVVY